MYTLLQVEKYQANRFLLLSFTHSHMKQKTARQLNAVFLFLLLKSICFELIILLLLFHCYAFYFYL